MCPSYFQLNIGMHKDVTIWGSFFFSFGCWRDESWHATAKNAVTPMHSRKWVVNVTKGKRKKGFWMCRAFSIWNGENRRRRRLQSKFSLQKRMMRNCGRNLIEDGRLSNSRVCGWTHSPFWWTFQMSLPRWQSECWALINGHINASLSSLYFLLEKFNLKI